MAILKPDAADYAFCARQIGCDPVYVQALAIAETDEVAIINDRAKVLFDPLAFKDRTQDKWELAKQYRNTVKRNEHAFDDFKSIWEHARENAYAFERIYRAYDRKQSKWKEPFTHEAQWEIIETADKVEPVAAAECCKYGVFQMWGYLAPFAGFADDDWAAINLRDAMNKSVRSQVEAFYRLVTSGRFDRLRKALQTGDVDGIAHHWRGASSTHGFEQSFDLAVRVAKGSAAHVA